MEFSTALSKKIFELRKQLKMTQSELGQKIGVSKAAVSQFEKGENRPSFDTIQKLSAVLEFDFTNLYQEPRAVRDAFLSQIDATKNSAQLLDFLQQALDSRSLRQSVDNKWDLALTDPGQEKALVDIIVAQAVAKMQEERLNRTYHLGKEATPGLEYDDRLTNRLIPFDENDLLDVLNHPEKHGVLRHRKSGDKYLITERAIREWLGDKS